MGGSLPGIRYRSGSIGNAWVFEIYPFDYMPAQNMIIAYTMNVDYSMEGVFSTFIDNNRMLILYNDEFESIIDSAELFFSRRGKSVSSYSLSSSGSTSDSIAAFIRQQYSSSPFSFLLILGDSRKVPGSWGEGDGNPYTDIYYSMSDSTDYIPEILVSRLPFDSSYKFTEFFLKAEQSMGINAQDMRKKAYFMATNDPGYHFLAESTQIYSMEKLRNINFNTDSLFYYYNTGTAVDEAINEGKAMAFYTGHGIAYQWSGPSFTESDIDSLHNSPYFPYIFSFACLTGNYFYTQYFGYQWLSTADRGAKGFIGSSKETYWEQDDILQKYFVDSLIKDKYIIEAFNDAKRDFLSYYGDNPTTKRYFEQYNYFSIPDMYFGNHEIYNVTLTHDRYEPFSEGNVTLAIDFDGVPEMSGFAGIYSDTLIDSLSIVAPGDYILYHSNNPGDTIYASLYFPGAFMDHGSIILLSDGPYVSVKDYAVSDISSDTLKFDIALKNFGNADALNINAFMQYMPDYITMEENNISCDSLMPESLCIISNALIFTVEDNAGAGSDTLCLLGIVFDSDTAYAEISISDLTPSFNAEFEYAVCGTDTSNAVTIGKVCDIHFTLKNTSSFKAKNITVSIDGAFSGINTVFACDSLMSGETADAVFAIVTDDPDSNRISVNMHIKMGSFAQEFNFALPVKLKNSYSFLGPLMGYYIYTSDMIDLENRPLFEDVRNNETGWRVLDFDDDETVCLQLPFEFRLGNGFYNKLYLNANGVISTDSIESPLFNIVALPSSSITGKAFVCAWNDFRFSDVTFMSGNINDLKGLAIYRTNKLNTEMTVLYNNVVNYDNDTFAFAIVIDTADITMHYYKIPQNNNLVTGIQFSNADYLSFSGDSFRTSDGTDLIRDSLSLSINDRIPAPVTKFSSEIYRGTHEPVLMSSPIAGNRELILGIFEPDIYSIEIFDIAGRKIENLHNGILNSGYHHFSSSINASGIYFIRVNNEQKCLLSRKITIMF